MEHVTRPEWRDLHRLTNLDLHIAKRVNRHCPKVIRNFVSYPPGEFTFNVVFYNGPKVNYLFTRGPGYPIRV